MKRVIYLDVLRVFSIFCVIFLHVSAGNWAYTDVNSMNFTIMNIANGSVRFATPVFVMISGALMLDPKYDFSIKKIFTKNISRIATAFIFWSVFYAMITLVLSGGTVLSFAQSIIVGHYHMWFLYMIVGLYIVLPIMRKIAENRELSIYFLVCSLFFVFICAFLKETSIFSELITTVLAKSNVNVFSGYTSYFLLGYFIKNETISKKTSKFLYIMGFGAIIFTILMTQVVSVATGVAYDKFYSYFMPNVLVVAVAVFVFFKNMKIPEKFEKYIIRLSNLTFGIFLIHPFANIIIYKFITTNTVNPIISIPLISVLSFGLSGIITYIISKNKFSKYII